MFGEITKSIQAVIAIAILVVLIGTGTGLYFWHKSEVRAAVQVAVQGVELEYAKKNLKLKERSDEAADKLSETIYKINKDKDLKVAANEKKYRDLVDWINTLDKSTRVRNIQGQSTGISSRVSDNPNDGKGTGEIVIGQLTRQDAKNLAEYGRDAEILRILVNRCYIQYDEVKRSLEEFRDGNARK